MEAGSQATSVHIVKAAASCFGLVFPEMPLMMDHLTPLETS
jgi:hypothetical protein